MIESTTMRRLALIRYLYESACNQSRQPEPLNAMAILSFHDAVELFLHLVVEYLDVQAPSNVSFMSYWDIAKTKLPDNGLTQKEPMRKLNQSRVAFKHYGTLPNKLDLEVFRVTTTEFFEENAQLVFGLNFETISLIDMVICDKCKEALTRAEEERRKGDLQGAMTQTAIAMAELIRDYELRKSSRFRRSPFYFGGTFPLRSGFQLGVTDMKFKQYMDSVKQTFESIQSGLKILSIGLDYRRYSRFRMLTPTVRMTIGERYMAVFGEDTIDSSDEEYRFCFDFVIESAIYLQEFDYDAKS